MRTLLVLFATALLSLLAPAARAQCDWLPGDPIAGADGDVYASVMWDPDGPGPKAPLLVIGGQFTTVGHAQARNLAAWDGANWTELGGGLNNTVWSLAVAADGSLFAGGDFTAAGGLAARRIARWNGSAWSALGAGADDTVYTLLALPAGDLIAAGYFPTMGGVSGTNRIARWNGSAWSPLSTGIAAGPHAGVNALARMPNGDVIAAGFFAAAGGVAMANIARWDGSAWHDMAGGVNSAVFGLHVRPDGSLIVGGNLNFAGAVPVMGVARWDGASWHAMGHGIGAGTVVSFTTMPNGDLVAGGAFLSVAGGINALRIARWDGTDWQPMAHDGFTGGMGVAVYTLTVIPDGRLVATGHFYGVDGSYGRGGNGADHIAVYNGAYWTALTPGTSRVIYAIARAPNDDLYATGDFLTIGGVDALRIARFDGQHWHPLGTGLTSDITRGVSAGHALAIMPNGDVVVGGEFNIAGGVPAASIARWDGASWHALGSGLPPQSTAIPVYALQVMPNGDLIAGGVFHFLDDAGHVNFIARWDGTQWLPVGNYINGIVYALALLPDGRLLAGGDFGVPPLLNHVAIWNGSDWTGMGTPMSAVHSLLVTPGGDIFLGGITTLPSFAEAPVQRWNGTNWANLGAGMGMPPGTPASDQTSTVTSLAMLPDGNLVAAGHFTLASGSPANHIARWNGSAWSAMGLGAAGGATSTINGLQIADNGDLVAVGDFVLMNGQVSAFSARWSCASPCAADLNGDGQVDFADYLTFLNLYDAQDPAVDFNGDGQIDFSDYLEFLNLYDAGC